MHREQTATFIGHRECYRLKKMDVQQAIEDVIAKGVNSFLLGGMGQFDWMCARTVFELKETYPAVRSTLIIPYLTFAIHNKSLYDDILYPEGFEKYYFKAAIPERNKYFVDHSAYAICYITHGWGGAAQTFERAVKKGLTVVNLGDITK